MIDFDKKIYEIVQEQPEVLDFLIKNGFDKLSNKMLLNTMGKQMSLQNALNLRKINVEVFKENLDLFLNGGVSEDLSLGTGEKKRGDLVLAGVLPCPVKIPLMEAMKNKVAELEQSEGFSVSLDLQAANLGIDGLKASFTDGDYEALPDVVMSAGYEFFFSSFVKEKYMDTGLYKSKPREINDDFLSRGADLQDPKQRYGIIGVVPAVFIVNKDALNGRKAPESWEDLLDESMEGMISIPHGDLDLFNAVVLTIYSKYGMEGVKNLRRAHAKSLHPAEMTRNRSNNPMPAVNVAPLFFSTMIRGEALEMVWPKDGAILSPIFLINKDDKRAFAVADAINSKDIGKILSFNGNFPSTCVGVDNMIASDNSMMWTGWDFINDNDIEDILNQIDKEWNK